MVRLESDRVLVRNFFTGDAEGLRRVAVSYSGSPYAKFDHAWPTSEEGIGEAIGYFASRDDFLAVCVRGSGRLVGMISMVGEGEGRFGFGYDASLGTVKNITQSSGGWSRTVSYAYSGSASTGYTLANVTDPDGRVTEYSYTRNYYITSVDYPTGGKTDYTYKTYSLGRSVKVCVERQTAYDSPSHVSAVRSYTYTGGFKEITGVSVGEYEGAYAPANLKKTTVVNNNQCGKHTAVFNGAAGAWSTALTRETEVSNKYGSPARISTWSTYDYEKVNIYGYDEWGNRVCDFSLGRQSCYSYSNTSTSRRFVNYAGRTVSSFTNSFYTGTLSYNIHNRLIGQAQLQSGKVSIESYYNYDSAGQKTASKSLLNTSPNTWVTESYSYDEYGNVIQSVDPRGGRTNYTYSSTYHGAYLTSVKRPLAGVNVTRVFEYDEDTGLLTRVVDESGNATDYAYDILGRVTNVTYPSTGGARRASPRCTMTR